MAYDQTVPNASHTPAQDQPVMQGNFLQIATSYNTDHIPLTSGSNVGYSNKTTYVSQASDPSGVASAGIAYSKIPVSHTELFYEGEAGTGKILQMTNQALTTASGEGFLAGGLQIRSGSAASNNGGVTTSFSSAFPTACISVVASGTNGGQPTNKISVIAKTASNFTLMSPLGEACLFIAIG